MDEIINKVANAIDMVPSLIDVSEQRHLEAKAAIDAYDTACWDEIMALRNATVDLKEEGRRLTALNDFNAQCNEELVTCLNLILLVAATKGLASNKDILEEITRLARTAINPEAGKGVESE